MGTNKITTTINGKEVDCWLEKVEDKEACDYGDIVLRVEKHNINHEGAAIVGLTTKGTLRRYYEGADLALGLVPDTHNRIVMMVK